MDKIRILLDRNLAKELKKMMRKEDNYTTIVEMLLKFYKEKREER